MWMGGTKVALNPSLKAELFPQSWKSTTVQPLQENKRKSFSGRNSRPVRNLPLLSKFMEKVVFEQMIPSFFFVGISIFSTDPSTCTAQKDRL